MRLSYQSSIMNYVSFCDQLGLKTCRYKSLLSEENKQLIDRLLTDSWSDWLKYIEKKSAFLNIFLTLLMHFIIPPFDDWFLAFRLSANSSIANPQIAMMIRNYNLGVVISIIMGR